MTDEMIVSRCRALGDPTRLKILRFLACCPKSYVVDEDGGVEGPSAGEICCHITGAEKITSTVSHHLHELAKADLITLQPLGKRTICALKPEGVRELSATLELLSKGVTPDECC